MVPFVPKVALLMFQLFQQLFQQFRGVLFRSLGGHAVHLHGAATVKFQKPMLRSSGKHVLHQGEVGSAQFHMPREEFRLAGANPSFQQFQVTFV